MIAALKGHAIAGGCILALCCDYRYITQGRKLMGLNEIKLGIPVPYPADQILRQLVGDKIASEIMYTGDFYESDTLKAWGMVDKVLPQDELLSGSIGKARSLAAEPQKAFHLIKQNRTEGVIEKIKSKLDKRQRIFIELWHSDEVRKLLNEAKKKF
jgi:enoyl-CoA hydratase/carnithine racemase